MKRATAGEDISTDLWESGVRPWIRAGGMRHVLSFCSSDNQRKVCTVILEVLDTLPPDDLALFLRTNPFFVCLDVSQGAALRFPPDGQGDGYVSMIYLHPGTFRRPADRIADLVAHEVAHLVLAAGGLADGEDENKLADDLAESWGFRRSYSLRDLKRLRELTELMDRERQKKIKRIDPSRIKRSPDLS